MWQLHFRDNWGDLVSVSLRSSYLGFWLIERYGVCKRTRYFFRWKSALAAYDGATGSAHLLVTALANTRPGHQSWPN